ncbi:MAG: gas vesicle protein GvpN [Bacillota bacterium]
MSKIALENYSGIIHPEGLPEIVETPAVKALVERSLGYIKAGFAVHLRGRSGTGKTSLALQIARRLGRPVALLHGDEQLSSTDLLGGSYGYSIKRIYDEFIQSVKKSQEDFTIRWMDSRLTLACKHGYTLVYDEFTRSRPEANNIFLSILQERVLDLPVGRTGEESLLKVHPAFAAIFTSNPEEYAGVYRSQDALRDRLVTLDLDYPDAETEVMITAAKSGLASEDCTKIVALMRQLRASALWECPPTVRGCIMIARTVRHWQLPVSKQEPLFRQICLDVLGGEISRSGSPVGLQKAAQLINDLLDQHC